MIQKRAAEANKSALEEEKERDELHNQIDQIEEQLHVSVCKDIMSCFSFLFLSVPRHYAKRPFSCWCTTCSRVQGRGLGSQSSDPDLLVSGCTRSNQTSWTEDQFTVTSSAGIRNREKRVADTVVRELKRAKPGAEVWSTEEEANMRSGDLRREEVRVAGQQVQVGE